jgi:hypothetical protein
MSYAAMAMMPFGEERTTAPSNHKFHKEKNLPVNDSFLPIYWLNVPAPWCAGAVTAPYTKGVGSREM